MLCDLKFCQGAVAKKDFVPAMTHFTIEKGILKSFNGVIALSSPIQFDVDCKPKAYPLIKAIANCGDSVSLTMLDNNRLKVVSGKFKAVIDCTTDETPTVSPEGERMELDGEKFLQSVKTLLPFVGTDASRPWSAGILMDGKSAYATNNICLIETWIGCVFPHKLNVPVHALKELARINEAPAYVQIAEKSITFHFTGDRWLRSQLFETGWPDVNAILDKGDYAKAVTVNPEIFDGIEALKLFTDKMGRVFFKDGYLSTAEDVNDGATFKIEGMENGGVFNYQMLALLKGVAQKADFTSYPAPVIFYGNSLRGAIIGIRL